MYCLINRLFFHASRPPQRSRQGPHSYQPMLLHPNLSTDLLPSRSRLHPRYCISRQTGNKWRAFFLLCINSFCCVTVHAVPNTAECGLVPHAGAAHLTRHLPHCTPYASGSLTRESFHDEPTVLVSPSTFPARNNRLSLWQETDNKRIDAAFPGSFTQSTDRPSALKKPFLSNLGRELNSLPAFRSLLTNPRTTGAPYRGLIDSVAAEAKPVFQLVPNNARHCPTSRLVNWS